MKVRGTPISAEDYLRKIMSETNRPLANDKLNKLIDRFVFLNQQEHFNNLKMEEKI